MRTRQMKQRITFFAYRAEQNEYGEVIERVKQRLYSCWAEVTKTNLKDFRDEVGKIASNENIPKSQDTKVFYIRYLPKLPFDTDDLIEFNKQDYRIVSIEPNYDEKDYIKVGATRFS